MKAISLGVVAVLVSACVVEDELALVEQEVVAPSWDGDFETGNLSQWAQGIDDGLPACTDALVDVQSSMVRQGIYAARFEVNDTCLFDSKGTPGDIGDDDQKVEISSDPDQTAGYAGQSAYYGWSIYVPESAPVPIEGTRTTIAQWKLEHVTDNCGGQNANVAVALRVQGGVELLQLHVSGGECTREVDENGKVVKLPTEMVVSSEPVARGQWHDLVLRARWSTGSDGLVELWWNGVKRWSLSHPNLFWEGSTVNPVRVRQGIYRDFCRIVDGGRACDHRVWTMYQDAMRRSSTYQDVALPNFNFERWKTTTSPTSWLSTGSAGLALTTFTRQATSSWSSLGCSSGSSGSYSLRIAARHDGTSTAFARGVRQEDGVKGTRVAPGRSYQVRANICSIDPPRSRGYRLRVFWFRADGTPSATVSSTGTEVGVNVRGLVQPRFDVVAPSDAAFGRVQAEVVSATASDTVDYAVDLVGLWNN